jgi:poly(3-hydroxybutyrate) depolymerase
MSNVVFRVVVAAVAAVGACSGSAPAAGQPPAANVAAAAVTYYTGHYGLPSGRTFYLRAPVTPGAAQPLVVALHGAAQSAGYMQTQTGLTSFSAGRFALAYGEGMSGTWNAGAELPAQPACCGYARDNHVDDVGYLRQVVAKSAAVTPVDVARVYVWGFSNGAMMAAKFGCQAPDLVAAVGVVGGGLLVPCAAGANMLHIHGTADATVPLAGGVGYGGVTFPPVWTEPTRMPAAALWSLSANGGGHAWPATADAQLWEFSAPLHR